MASRKGAAATAVRGRKTAAAAGTGTARKRPATAARKPRRERIHEIVARCEQDEAFRERLLARLASAAEPRDEGAAGAAPDEDAAGAGVENPGNVSVRVAPRYLKTFRLRIGTINWNRND